MSLNKINFRLFWPALALIIVPAAGAIWFGFISTEPFVADSAWHDFIGIETGTPVFAFASIFHYLGSTKGMAVVSAIILLVLVILKKWWHAIALASTMLSVLISSKIIKFLVDRPRPEDMLVLETETSFPSGHSLGAGAIAAILVSFVWASNKFGLTARILSVALGALYILAMMWSRTALQVHWLSDTIAGALLGVALAIFFAAIFLPQQKHEIDNQVRHSSTGAKHG